MKNRKKYLAIIFILLFIAELSSAQINLPQDNFVDGWIKSGKERHFSKETLFNYINGGAELFLEFGFKNLSGQSYKKGDAEINLEIYQMENTDAALGIYLKKCGKETPDKEINARNSFDRYQLTIVKGCRFIQINNFSGREENKSPMLSLAAVILAQITDGKFSNLLNILPRENLVSGSELILRGPYALQPVYTFGKGDILQLKGKVFAVAGDYKDADGNIFTRLIIPYENRESAKKAWKNLLANLDSYLKIIDQQKNKFSFIDYKKKYVIAEIRSNVMEIKINLTHIPGKD